MNKKYLVASSALTIALLGASTAFADEGHHNKMTFNFGSVVKELAHRFNGDNATATSGVNFGGQVSVLAHEKNSIRHEDRQDREDQNDNDQNENENEHDRNVNATTTATTTEQSTVSISGMIAALNGSTLTINGNNGAVYTVNAANATLNGSTDITTLGKVQIGDRVEVTGTLNGTTINAIRITDRALRERTVLTSLSSFRIGVVSALSGTGFTLDRFGTGTTSVTTNASTTYKFAGAATTSSSLANGQLVLVSGTANTGATDSITASVVYIVNITSEFLQHLFR